MKSLGWGSFRSHSKASSLKLGCDVDKTFQLQRNFFKWKFIMKGDCFKRKKCLILTLRILSFRVSPLFHHHLVEPLTTQDILEIQRLTLWSARSCLLAASWEGGHNDPAVNAPVWLVRRVGWPVGQEKPIIFQFLIKYLPHPLSFPILFLLQKKEQTEFLKHIWTLFS